MFAASVMTCRAYLAPSVPRLIAVETVERLATALRQRTSITMMGIKAVIHVAVKPCRSVEPWSGADKEAAREPVRSVVAVRSTAIWRVVKISVGADRRRSDTDPDLGLCFRRCA